MSLYNERKKTGQLTVADAEAVQDKINAINKEGKDKTVEIEAETLAYQKKYRIKR
ncbi:MAG: hypothetical protein IPJ81_00595 [Chitinophagaceae bacterium]|nr:hypothetical protein [Chitinophagaceae bacterium]